MLKLASLANKSQELELARWASYTWALFEVRFTAEVIPYQEHWKRVNKVES